MKRMVEERDSLLIDERQAHWRWTRGYVGNVAHAIVVATLDDRTVGAIYNVGDPHTPTEAERVAEIAAAVGWTGSIERVPAASLPQHLREPLNWKQHLWADTSRFRRVTGYGEAVSRKDGLAATIRWERETGW